MRENFVQIGKMREDQRLHIEGDWYRHGIPCNVKFADSVYVDTSYGFAAFHSTREDAMCIDKASGCYDRASFVLGENAKLTVGKYCIINGSTIVCQNQITIGDHCMLAWGSVLTDSWLNASFFSVEARRTVLEIIASDPKRPYPFMGVASPIVLEDNCWVGFDAVILPGVRLGRGCVVGCKTVVERDVPPYAVITGSPATIVKYLPANDTVDKSLSEVNQYLK